MRNIKQGDGWEGCRINSAKRILFLIDSALIRTQKVVTVEEKAREFSFFRIIKLI